MFSVIDILHIFLLWYFLCTQFYSSRTPLKPEPRSGGTVSANHNTELFESQKSLFHGSGAERSYQIKTYSRASVSAGVIERDRKVWKTHSSRALPGCISNREDSGRRMRGIYRTPPIDVCIKMKTTWQLGDPVITSAVPLLKSKKLF